ncbi:unnamed protein product [Trifolium pratense]|uniref:Uncharacterized protein n=1 Tax=Trifolium pratense TaxID=57577 RepID=A0ACB0K875_TRIPR|nr:unnamed protein product [Trifolium pratense]
MVMVSSRRWFQNEAKNNNNNNNNNRKSNNYGLLGALQTIILVQRVPFQPTPYEDPFLEHWRASIYASTICNVVSFGVICLTFKAYMLVLEFLLVTSMLLELMKKAGADPSSGFL